MAGTQLCHLTSTQQQPLPCQISYPPDLTIEATTFARLPWEPPLLFKIRLTFFLELSALWGPCLMVFIPALFSMPFSLHLVKHSFLPPLPTCLSAFDSHCPQFWGISTFPTTLSTIRFQSPPSSPVLFRLSALEPKVASEQGNSIGTRVAVNISLPAYLG